MRSPGIDTSQAIYSGMALNSPLPHRIGVDEATGDIYILHDSINLPGNTAASSFTY